MSEPFWSDDFDMDLLKVMPFILNDLGPSANIPLWTVGHTTHGRLNHPTVWNTHGAFVWTGKPFLPRNEHGWFNIGGCVDDSPLIECTWLELLRDQWTHDYAFILLPNSVLFQSAPRTSFDRLMYNLRGWDIDEPAGKRALMKARLWVVESTRRLKRCLA